MSFYIWYLNRIKIAEFYNNCIALLDSLHVIGLFLAVVGFFLACGHSIYVIKYGGDRKHFLMWLIPIFGVLLIIFFP